MHDYIIFFKSFPHPIAYFIDESHLLIRLVSESICFKNIKQKKE